MQKNFIARLVVVIVAVLAIAVGIYYSKNKNTETPLVTTKENSSNPKIISVPEYIPPATWKTYVNTKYSYSFKYPPHYALHPDSTGTLGDLFGDVFDVTTPFHQNTPGSDFVYTGALFVVAGLPDKACPESTGSKKILGNNIYSVSTQTDNGAENRTKVFLYSVTHNGQCASFSLEMRVPGKNAPSVPGLLDVVGAEERVAEQILSTLKFTK